MALIDTGLVVRYYIDEAASGTSPTEVIDTSGVGAAFDLTLNYDGHLAYTEVSGNRGLVSDSSGDDQYAKKAIDDSSDKVRDNLVGAQKITIELVVAPDSFAAGTGRCFAVNEGTFNMSLGFGGAGTDFQVFWEGTLMRSWTGSGGTRIVLHIVYDTTQGTAANRVRVYVDGSEISPDVDASPAENDTLALDSGHELWMLNRGSGSPYARSMDGIIYYAALYGGKAFDQTDVTTNYDILTADDDTPGAPPAGIVVLRRRR